MADNSVDEEVAVLNKAAAKQQPEYLVPPVIAKALIAIQKKLEPIVKTAENSEYNSSYTPLDVIAPLAHKLLTAHKISVIQSPIEDSHGNPALETILVHESGKSFVRTTRMASIEKLTPQSHGAAITYYRRFTLMSMLGFSAKGEDDDGNKASGVLAPVQVEQIEQIRMLLSLIPWPKEHIDTAVRAIRTKDAADLAIAKYQRLTSEIKRDQEAIVNADAPKVHIQVDDGVVVDESTPQGTLQARITALGLKDKTAENKFVFSMTGRPFLIKVKDPEDLKTLSNALDKLESGERALGSDFYPPTPPGETRIVEEPVA